VVHIISDSIAKYVDGITGATVIAFPGMTTARLASRVQRDAILLSKKYTIFHVGTNDVCHLSEDEIIADFNNLITVVRKVSSTKILLSSFLPRLVDYSMTGDKVKDINTQLKQLCEERHVQFLHSFRPYFKEG